MKTFFALFLITNCIIASAQIYPTNAQVFNFAVGDTFVYQVTNNIQLQNKTFERMVVIARQDSGNTTKYTLQHAFNYDTTLHSYLACDTVLQIINQDTSIVSCYNAYYSMADGCFCTWFIFNGPSYESTSWGDSTLGFGGACANGGGGSYNVYAVTGLGVVYINSWCEGGGAEEAAQYCNLVYYHLTNGTIGGIANYYILGLPDLVSGEALIQLVPNPAHSQFEIKTAPAFSEEADFKLFDVSGKVLLNHKLKSNNTVIQRQDVSNGVYFWQVDVGGKTVKTGNVCFE